MYSNLVTGSLSALDRAAGQDRANGHSMCWECSAQVYRNEVLYEPASANCRSCPPVQINPDHVKPPVVICGPSGVGKGTLIAKLMSKYEDAFGFCVSHTTRDPRPGEEEGVHYYFSTRPEVQNAVAEGLFLEHAEVHGNMYGTSLKAVADVSDLGKLAVLDIDVQGAEQVSGHCGGVERGSWRVHMQATSRSRKCILTAFCRREMDLKTFT